MHMRSPPAPKNKALSNILIVHHLRVLPSLPVLPHVLDLRKLQDVALDPELHRQQVRPASTLAARLESLLEAPVRVELPGPLGAWDPRQTPRELIHQEVPVVDRVPRGGGRGGAPVRLRSGQVVVGVQHAIVAVVRRAAPRAVAAPKEEQAGVVLDELRDGGPFLDVVLIMGVVDVVEEPGASEGRSEVGGAALSHFEFDDEDFSLVGLDERPASGGTSPISPRRDTC